MITALEGKSTLTSVKQLRVTVYEWVCQKRCCPLCDTKPFTAALHCHDNNNTLSTLSSICPFLSFSLSVSSRALSSSLMLPRSWDSCPSWRYNMLLHHYAWRQYFISRLQLRRRYEIDRAYERTDWSFMHVLLLLLSSGAHGSWGGQSAHT